MRTFYIVWFGQFISTLGSRLTAFAISVWIFEQTRDATPFILTSFFDNLPYVIVAIFAGTIVDRYSRRAVMVISDIVSAIMTVIALLLFTAQLLDVWHVWLIAAVASITRAFQEPAWSASIAQLVPQDQLPRAAGMGQLSHAVSMLGAPAIAGVLYTFVGLQGVIWVDLATFVVAVLTLGLVKFPAFAKADAPDSDFKTQLLGGYRYLRSIPGLFYLMIVFALVNFTASAGGAVSGPLVLAIGSAQDYGFVRMLLGAGLVVGSLVASFWNGPKTGMVRTIFLCISCLGFGFILAGSTPSILLIGIGFFLAVLLIPLASALSQAIHQTRVPQEYLGRTFAFSGMVTRLFMPISFLIAGPLIDNVFEPALLEGGVLAQTWIGLRFGTGAGRGSGLFIMLMGGLLLIVLAIGYLNPRIRNLEIEVPTLDTLDNKHSV